MRSFEAIGALGTEITGYPLLSVYNDFTSDKSNPRHGVFVDWAYDHFGALPDTPRIDLNGDRIHDLILGAPTMDGQLGGAKEDAGQIYVIYGTYKIAEMPVTGYAILTNRI